MWGFFPLYFNRLAPAEAPEVIVHRAFWAFVFCLVLLLITRQLGTLKSVLHNRATAWRLSAAGFLIIINWTTYIYAVQNGRTIDAALGYFINPLITVALAIIFLREKTRILQKIALFFGVMAVLVFIIGLGYLPWVSIVCPLSFGFYALVKKDVAKQVPPLVGMVIETAVVIPFLLAYYLYLVFTQTTSFHDLARQNTEYSTIITHGFMLVGAGILTAIPLILLARASQALSLGVLGLLQYLSPVMQLTIALVIFQEPVETIRWIGTAIVWVALFFLVLDGFQQSRQITKLKRISVSDTQLPKKY